MKLSSVASGLGFSGLFSVLGTTAGVPWGALLAVAVLIIVSVAAVTIVQQLMPQDSHHKLQLWTTMIRQRSHSAALPSGDRMPPAGRR